MSDQQGPSATQATAATATADPNRHGLVDALRGLSLLGILVVNIEFIVASAEQGWLDFTSGTDYVVRWLIITFGQTKVYPLFALLFGYGLALQVKSADRSGLPLWPRYRRRMIGFLLLGVAHGVLFFPGDILVIYACIGAVAYRFRSTPTERLLFTATRIYAAAAVIWLIIGGLDATSSTGSSPAPDDALRTLTDGSFAEVAELHVGYWLVTLLILTFVQGPAVFASFLVGIALGRSSLLSDPDAHRATARRALRWFPLGVVVAGIGATVTLVSGRWETLGFAIGFCAAPILAAGYVAALALLVGNKNGVAASTLRASGRMSLTVYLLESVVASTLAYGYGFGLFGETSPLEGTLIAIAVWLGLSAFAVGWMRMFRFGPFEWLLRSFTYAKRQPLVRR